MSIVTAIYIIFLTIVAIISFCIIVYKVIMWTRGREYEVSTYAITEIQFYEPWDEIVYEDIEERFQNGVDVNGNPIYGYRTVRKEKVVYHDEYFKAILSNGDIVPISRDTYISALKRFGTEEFFFDMKRNFYSIDGNMWYCLWNRIPINTFTLSFEKGYTNPVRCKNSIFNRKHINKKTAKQEGLYEKYTGDLCYECVYGYGLTPEQASYIGYVNDYLTNYNGMRILFLFFYDKQREIATKQRDYWLNGSRNELVVCVGIKDNKIDWCVPFSWSNDRTLELMVASEVLSHRNVIDVCEWAQYVMQNADKWVYNDLSEYDYLKGVNNK